MKSIKKKISSISVIAIILIIIGLEGCDDVLEGELYDSVPVSAFYKNQEQVQLALNGAYSGFWNTIYYDGTWFILNDHTGGSLSKYSSADVFDTFSWTVADSKFQGAWKETYEAINRTNTLLDNIPNADIPSEIKMNVSGQAKFLRALYYFDLVQLFGGVPLYINGTADLSKANEPRSNTDVVYQQIVKDLQDATQELTPYREDDHAAGKATSGAALALLAKVYIQQRDWSNAAATAKKVIDMNVFELNEDFSDVFDPVNNNKKESIFSIQHGSTGNSNDKLGNHSVFRFGPSPQTKQDGTNIEFYHNSTFAAEQANLNFYNSTPGTYRKWQSMRDKMPYYYIIGESNLINDTIELERPYVIKYNHLDMGSGDLKTAVNAPVLRYSDVLLTYAEALNEENGGPTQEAYVAINTVRDRARGMGTSFEQSQSLYPPLSELNQSQFRDSVLIEEAREFVGEGHRRLDLLRHDKFISNAKERGIDASEKHKLFPIPSEEIARNPNLEQNPGYSQ